MSGAVMTKSFDFAVRIVRFARLFSRENNEWVLSKQILRSGTSIGANIREAEHAQSKADFIHKMNIALKEANETLYWIELLYASELINKKSFDSLHPDCDEIVRLLVSIVKTSKTNVEREGAVSDEK